MLKEGQSIDTTFYPPQFSLDNTFNLFSFAHSVKVPNKIQLQGMANFSLGSAGTQD